MKFLLLLSLFVTTLFANHHNREELQKVSLQLHWKYQFEFAGFIAAKEKGFYKDVGLDVELREYEDGIDIEDDVLCGKATYGIYNSLALLEYLRGKSLVLLSSYFKRAALVLVAKPEIKSPKDLVTKRIMATTKDDFMLNFGLYLRGYGVSVDDVELVPHSYSVDDFAQGKVDAMTAFVSNELYKLDDLGVHYNVLDPSDDNLYILQLELITSKEEATKHPGRTKAFRDASLKGWQYALSHKDELVDIIKKKYQIKLSKESIKKEALGVQKLILPYTYELGSIDRSFLKKQKELFLKEYHIQNEKSLDDYLFHPKTDTAALQFSDKELNYINNNKKIDICINYDLFPLDGIKNDKLTGEMGDIFSIISNLTSLEFTPVASASEKDLMENLQNKKCKMLSVVATANKEFTTIQVTPPFSATSFALLSKLERSFVDDPTLLKDKVLIVQKDSFRAYLKYLYPYLRIKVEYDKNKMVRDVLYNKAYAIVTLDEQADYFIDKYGYGKLKISGFLAKDRPIQGSIGIQKDEKTLYSIINKALKHISKEKIESIRNSWRISRYQTTIDYSLALKTLFFMGVIVLIMIYYQRKLKNFNKELERQVYEKTKELREINESLEATVQEKIEELIQKDEILTIQSKQAVMGEMISMIAHQWRQPLNTITLQISSIQLKEMIGEKITKEELLKILDEISNSIIYLSNTIDDFKTYFHPAKEAVEIQIGELIMKCVSFIEPRLKKDEISLELQGNMQIKVHVYANELIQVFLNILNNAIDAYETGSSKNRYIIIEIESKEDKIIIKISDNAGGIKKENFQKIFEPYFSTKGKNGTGLGLYMSKMIIEKQFNGKIDVESSDNQSTFIIEVPKRVHS
ncbi:MULTISPECIES: ABC transporter substrate-binding protein [Sulfurimonas]|uniref:ABC transporter substrate-binding protein n=1 Tax=Sulfurimonas TaxID=202746 RepID=UPI0012644FC2|nr:ABC transporter substrate-binding protein [Sulfurimonas indica]